MGCCVQRAKYEDYSIVDLQEPEILAHKSVPTYQVLKQIYEKQKHPEVAGEASEEGLKDGLLTQKEEMIVMIINLLRLKPRLFMS